MGRRWKSAELLAGCSIREIEARRVNWRTCSDEALIALRPARSRAWLAAFTGYTAQVAVGILRKAGLDWRTETTAAIRKAIAAHHTKQLKPRTKLRVAVIDGREYTAEQIAVLAGVSVATLDARCRRKKFEKAARESLARPGRWIRHTKRLTGRPRAFVTIDGETRSRHEWLAIIEMTRQGVWKAAKRNRRTPNEELTERVRARRSDAVHAPASTAVASDQPPRVVRGDRVASACAALERGAVANDSKEAAA